MKRYDFFSLTAGVGGPFHGAGPDIATAGLAIEVKDGGPVVAKDKTRCNQSSAVNPGGSHGPLKCGSCHEVN